MPDDDMLRPDPAVNRSLGALQNYLSAQRETSARYRELQHANQQLDPDQVDVYAAAAAKITDRYRDGSDDRDWDVSWEITVTAPTAQAAARAAASVLCKADPHAQVLDVRPADAGSTGEDWTQVDLARDGR
jgi:hypothetical protein